MLEQILEAISAKGIFTRLLRIDYAVHSPQMEPLKKELTTLLSGIAPQHTVIPLVSTVTGSRIDGTELVPTYWSRNLREPVLFMPAVIETAQNTPTVFIEISPHPTLTVAIQQIFDQRGLTGSVLASCRRENEHMTLYHALGDMYELGAAINWEAVYPTRVPFANLPCYPWQRSRYWFAPETPPESLTFVAGEPSSPDLPLDTSATGVDTGFYSPRWVELPPAENPTSQSLPADAVWLIFSDAQGTGHALASSLHKTGIRCIQVRTGQRFSTPDVDHYSVHPTKPEDYQNLFRHLGKQTLEQIHGVVHLWSLDHTADTCGGAFPEEEAVEICGSLVVFLREFLAFSPSAQVPLWLTTSGAQAVTDSPVHIHHAPLWGLGRTLALEYPGLWGGVIDVDPKATPEETAALLEQHILRPDAEDHFAFRAGRRYGLRLEPAEFSTHRLFSIRPDSSYLITGGLGGLGLIMARWLAARGARRLVVLGRTTLPPRSAWSRCETTEPAYTHITALRELEARGVSVQYASVDVSDDTAVRRFFNQYTGELWPPIRGIVHTAGVLQDHTLATLNPEDFRVVLKPKASGSWNLLHAVTPDTLDFFWLVSSLAGFLGSPGAGNYAAANAFLDTFAAYARAHGWPTLSIGWGPWEDTGFSKRIGHRERMARLGVGVIPVSSGPALLDMVARHPSPHVLAASIDWAQWKNASPHLFHSIKNMVETHEPAAGNGPSPLLLYQKLPVPERLSFLEKYMQQLITAVLRLPPKDIHRDHLLNKLGIDSLMAVEMKNKIETDLNTGIAVTTFLKPISIAALAEELQDRIQTGEAVSPPSPPREESVSLDAAQMLMNLDHMTEEQMDSLLRELLDNGNPMP